MIEKVLEEQPDILAINRRYSYDALKEVLAKWLNPEEVTASETPAAVKEEDDFIAEMNKPVTPAYSLETAPAKTSNADKFNDLFND